MKVQAQLIALLAAVWASVSPVNAQGARSLYTSDQTGDSTYYSYSGAGGHCAIDVLPPWASQMTYLAAINAAQYRSGDVSAGCGVCVQGTSDGTGSGANPPQSPFTAYIVDECPEGCQTGDLDFGTGQDGRWGVSWRAIPCPVGSTGLQYEFEGSNAWYLKVGIRNHRCAVDTVEVRSRPGQPWRQATRTPDNFFLCNGDACGPRPFSFPLPVRVTSAFGETVEDTIPSLVQANNSPMNGSSQAQFAACGSATSPQTTTQTATTTNPTNPTNPTSPPSSGADTLALAGVNLAGADFGHNDLPGVFNTHYIYPTNAEVDYFVSKGMNLFRIPFRWERLQRSLNAPFNSAELSRLTSIVNYITTHAGPPSDPSQLVYALIDPHNYARYHDGVVGAAVNVTAFQDFWRRLAIHFSSNGRVIFGLMNEPRDMATELWLSDANAAISAIRTAGATNVIAVPGNAWTGAHSWFQNWYGTPNSQVMLGVVDPIDNFVFELHQYLDGDSSGTNAACVSDNIGRERTSQVTQWLRDNGYRAILAEFGGGRNAQCYRSLDKYLDFLEDNSDVWLGWVYWAAGPWWGDYIFTIEPNGGADRPQMSNALVHHLPASGVDLTTTPSETTSATAATTTQTAATTTQTVATTTQTTATTTATSAATTATSAATTATTTATTRTTSSAVTTTATTSAATTRTTPPATNPPVNPPGSALALAGVNLAGADFGEGNLPGTYNTHYTYPTEAEVDYFVSKGMNLFRIPFRWERLQRALNAPFHSAELWRLESIVNYITTHAGPPSDPSQLVYALIDPHNYARYQDGLVGEAVSVAAFQDFWRRLATHFRDNRRVIFGLMNEPRDMATELWLSDANAAIAAIRATGAANVIAVPGNAWTGAHSWFQNWYGTPNSQVMRGVVDPMDNFVFELHQYLDGDSSGTNANCVSDNIGRERTSQVTQWLRDNGYRAILAEFAGGRNAQCYRSLDNYLDFLEDNSDVWLGWVYWAAGPWWGDYIFTLEPNGGSDRPQMANALVKHLPASGIDLTTAPSGTNPTNTGATTATAPTRTTPTGTNPPVNPQANLPLAGVSLAGADFGEGNLPGEFGVDYTYPTEEEVDYFVSKGMNVLRICFRWERLQRTLNGAFDTAELTRLLSIVRYVTSHAGPPSNPGQPIYALIDPHNYARYHDQVIGDRVPVEAFMDFWQKLARIFINDQQVFFGLMNEPHDMPTELWLLDANAAIRAIRSTGARNLITVPGNAWSGAHSWFQNWYGTPNAEVMGGVVDSGDNFAFELHQYLDGDSSGTNPACVSDNVGVERVAEVTVWMRERGYRVILGEFAGGANDQCYRSLGNMLRYLEGNSDVWIGWVWWAAGPWWGDYIYSIEPEEGVDKPQMANVLVNHLPARGLAITTPDGPSTSTGTRTEGGRRGMSGGRIGGIAIAGIVCGSAFLIGGVVLHRRRRRKRALKDAAFVSRQPTSMNGDVSRYGVEIAPSPASQPHHVSQPHHASQPRHALPQYASPPQYYAA